MSHWFYLQRDNGLLLSRDCALLLIGREAVGWQASPSAAVIDSQSDKTSESGGPRSYSAAKSFVALPRRWVVKRSLAWPNRNRRLAKDFAEIIYSATASIVITSIQRLVRRIARRSVYGGHFSKQSVAR